MKNQDIVKKARNFLLFLEKSDKVAVLHHTDADGVCSGVLAAKAVESARGKKPDISFSQRDGETSVTEDTVKMLKSRGINKLIITDLAVDATPSTITALGKFCDVLIIDHHLKINDVGSEKVLLVKAQDISKTDPSRYPASKMVYDIFSELLEKHAWVAGIGLLGDYAESVWNDFLSEIEKRGTSINDMKAAEELIGYARATKQEAGVAEAFKVIYSAKNVHDVLSSPLAKYREAIEGELERHMVEHKKTALFSGDLVLYEIKQKYNVKSRLSNVLSHELYPDKTVVVIQVGRTRADISARRQDMKKSMAELMKKAVAGIPNSLGGGHVPAAGGYFPKEYLGEVKKRLISLSQ